MKPPSSQKPGDALRQIRQPTPQTFDIHIASDGSWYHEGGLIGRPALVKLFASVLRREADGSFWLVTPVERGTITVEDAPFIVTSMEVEGDGEEQQVRFRTNVEDDVVLGPDHPLQMRADPAAPGNRDGWRPYVVVRDGLEARLSRPVFYELAALSIAGADGRFGVWSQHVFFPLEADAEEADAEEADAEEADAEERDGSA